MIKHEWRRSLSPDEAAELSDLLERAAAYDAEPEYSTIDFADIELAMSQANSSVLHLLIWMLPYATAMGQPDEPERIAGLLRLVFTSKHAAEVTAVIDPNLRSIGIMTLLLEQLGVDASLPDGWMGTGAQTVTAWAKGSHPAADRLSVRFLIPRTRRIWKLIRSTDSGDSDSPAAALEPITQSVLHDVGWASTLEGSSRLYALRENGCVVGVVALDLRVVDSEVFGRCTTVSGAIAAPNADAGCMRRLLEGAAETAYVAGLTGLIIYADSDDADLVNACRRAGFQHDRTDVRFQLGKHA